MYLDYFLQFWLYLIDYCALNIISMKSPLQGVKLNSRTKCDVFSFSYY